MSVQTATEFLKDIANHSDVPRRAAATDVDGLRELAAELGFDDVTAADLKGAIEELGGSADDEVSGFLLSNTLGISSGSISMGDLGGTTLGAKTASSSTHGPERRKWPRPGCDCDTDMV